MVVVWGMVLAVMEIVCDINKGAVTLLVESQVSLSHRRF